MKERETIEMLKTFAEQRTLGLPSAWTRTARWPRATDRRIPAHVVIAPNGRIVYQGDELPAGFEQDGAGLLSP
jgi:hypothetical protein